MLLIDKKLMDEIFDECRRKYPEEACGLLVGSAKPERKIEKVVPCRNVQNELHQSDPVRYPRDAKTAYVIDPKEIEKITGEAKKGGLEVISMFHSHPEHEVYFSAEDRAMAAPWGEPLFPSLSYIVISIYGREVKGASEFYWDSTKKDYLERKII